MEKHQTVNCMHVKHNSSFSSAAMMEKSQSEIIIINKCGRIRSNMTTTTVPSVPVTGKGAEGGAKTEMSILSHEVVAMVKKKRLVERQKTHHSRAGSRALQLY